MGCWRPHKCSFLLWLRGPFDLSLVSCKCFFVWQSSSTDVLVDFKKQGALNYPCKGGMKHHKRWKKNWQIFSPFKKWPLVWVGFNITTPLFFWTPGMTSTYPSLWGGWTFRCVAKDAADGHRCLRCLRRGLESCPWGARFGVWWILWVSPKNQGWKKKQKLGKPIILKSCVCFVFFFWGGKMCVPSFFEVAYNVIEMSGQTYLGQVFVPMKKAFSKLKEKQRVKQICIAGEGVNGVWWDLRWFTLR